MIRRITEAALCACGLALIMPASANAALSVTPITWNVIGLDSNNPTTGPRFFPVGARVCSSTATANVAVNWVWDSANANINLRAGSLASLNIASIPAGGCADAYFEVQVTPVAAAFDTTRRYHITADDGSSSASTPIPRELYVEHLISQNRNSITGIKLDGVAIPAGGSMNLAVGNTYSIELDGGTATQGYNQFEAFINIPNTIFQILSVSTTYSADNSPYVPGPAPIANDKLYADACLWQNDPASPNYRSCVGGDFKAGGTDVRTTYTVRIVSGGGTSQTLSTLLYDFSGSSFHYNADFSTNVVIANIVDPAALTFGKAFTPAATAPGGTSTLTFTIANPTSAAVSGANFSDSLPLLSGGQMVVATPATFSTSGCGSSTFSPVAGASSVSFSNGTVAANSSCVVSVLVTIPSLPASGTYVNILNRLFVGAQDTGHTANANLGVTAGSTGSNLCGLTLAQWTMPTSAGTAVPPAFSLKAADVASATAAAGSGITTTIDTTIGDLVNSWSAIGFSTAATLTTSNNDYFEFAATTTNYTGIGFQFGARLDTNLHGPQTLQLFSSTDGVTFTPYGSTISPTATFTTFNPAFSGTANASGPTYFRIYGYNAGNNGADADLFLDNVTITGCKTPQPPTLTKAFLSSPVAVGGVSTLRFTLTNPNTAPLTGATFSDALPAGLQVAASPAAGTTCGGSPSWSPTGGATTLNFSGGTIPSSGTCTVSVDITATTAGPHTNVSGFISSTESGTNSGSGGSAVASLTAILPPTISKSFTPNPIVVNGTSTLTFALGNSNPNDALSGVGFSDTYPASVTNANPLPAVSNSCGGTVTAVAGGSSTVLVGGSIPAGGACSIAVTVTVATAGNFANTSGPVTANTVGAGNVASDTLTVGAPNPAISLLKQISTSATGPWFKFLSAAPGTPLYYQFTVDNIGDVPLNPFAVTDATLAGTAADPAGCVWTTSNAPSTLPALPVASATIDPTATCVVGPIAATLGDFTNTATAHGTFGGTVYNSSPSSAEDIGAPPGFSLLKQIGTSATGPWTSAINVAVGSNVFYKFTLVNTGSVDLASISVTDPIVSTASCTFTDPLGVGAATVCVVGPVTASGSDGSTTTNTAAGQGSSSGGPISTTPSSASYTITAPTADLAITKTDGVTSVNAGGSTTYTITVSNSGPSEVTNATVADIAPAGMTFGTRTCAVSNPGSAGTVTTACAAASGSGDISETVTMQVGAVITYTVPATIAAGATGSMTNTATVAPPSGTIDPTPGNNAATDSDIVALIADLAITKTDGVTSVNAGGSTIYTVTVTNNGPGDVAGATVTDIAPAALTFGTWTCSVSNPGGGGTVTTACGAASGSGNLVTTATMQPGATIVYTIPATIAGSASGAITNTATVTVPAGTTDPNPANNSATDTDTVIIAAAIADLAITKTSSASNATAGDNATYTITLTNNGPSEVAGATVTDIAPAGVTFGIWTCTVNNPGSGGVVITACGAASGSGNLNTTATLKPGAIIVYMIPATIGASVTGTVVNTATAQVPVGTTDPNPGNNTATSSIAVTAIALVPIPTLSTWLLAGLSLLLILLGALALPRERHPKSL